MVVESRRRKRRRIFFVRVGAGRLGTWGAMPWRRSLAAGWIEMRQQDPAGDCLSNRHGQEFCPRAINAVLGFCGLLSHTSKRVNVLRSRNRTCYRQLSIPSTRTRGAAMCRGIRWEGMLTAVWEMVQSKLLEYPTGSLLWSVFFSLFTNMSFITAFPPADITKCNTRCALGSYQRDK